MKFNILKTMIKDFSISKLNKDLLVISTEDYDLFKKIKSDNNNLKVVSTHSGAFHADEVLGCTMTKYINKYKNSFIIRSRNNLIHKEADIVLDVGGVFNPDNDRFDHHMKEFNHTFDDVLKIKMSSAGLAYKYYGKEVIQNMLKALGLYDNNKDHIDLIWNKVYVNFIASVDAHDNGITQYETGNPLYYNSTSYSHRIARINPEWNEPQMDQSEQFKLAMDVAEDEMLNQIKMVAKSYLAAYDIVKIAVDNRFNIHHSGKIILLETSCPWKEQLYEIENEYGLKDAIKFVLYKDLNEGYRIQTVPLEKTSFKFRVGIHSDWRGVQRDKLKEISGLDDVVFVHSSGFIGGAKSLESVLKMAEISLNKEESSSSNPNN